jgi:hypothetical protein
MDFTLLHGETSKIEQKMQPLSQENLRAGSARSSSGYGSFSFNNLIKAAQESLFGALYPRDSAL